MAESITNATRSIKPPIIVDGEVGASITREEYLTPNFEDKTLNRGHTTENAGFLRLKLELDKFRINIDTAYGKHVAGEENPYYPEGFRVFGLNLEGRKLLNNHFGFKVGRIPMFVGRTFGLVDGSEAVVHSKDQRYSLTAFGGAVPEPITMALGDRIGWGIIGTAEIEDSWINANFHQVFDEDRNIERERIGITITNNNIRNTEISGFSEYDPENETFTRLSLGGRCQINKRWWAKGSVARKNPTFEPGSFFNTFPHYPYYRYAFHSGYDSKKIGAELSYGQILLEYDSIIDIGADITLYGFSLGGAISRGSGDPYLNYAEFHGSYEINIRNRAVIGANGSFYIYEDYQFDGNQAFQAGGFVNWEFAKDFVLNGSIAMRKNVDGVSDPIFSVGLTYFFLKAFERGKK